MSDHHHECAMCSGEVTDLHKSLREKIDKFGWATIGVGTHAYVYTVGLFIYEHPEIVICGLPCDRAYQSLACAVDSIRHGEKLLVGSLSDGVFSIPAKIGRVNRRARDDYGLIKFDNSLEFGIVQALWPDKNGYYPGQKKFTRKGRLIQPRLSRW